MAGMGARDIKRKIKSVNSTKQITKAMELVSTAKLKRNKDILEHTKPYFEKVLGTVQHILTNEKNIKHEYLESRPVKHTLYIVVTADRGLCGGYNVNAIKQVVTDIDDASKAKIISIGKKATDFFNRREADVVDSFIYISEKPTYQDAQDIANKALRLYAQEKVDEIKFVYTKMESTISQVPTMIQLLPVVIEETEVVELEEFITYEPSPEAVLGYLIPKYIESTIYGGLVESAASEQAARRLAMESATDNAQEMIDDLSLTYNQARQAAITQEISEIVGGANALE
ncbi:MULTISPECIES: ATP synthase F1 subunit gamma [unclassified Fusibacter]|uniref:ATP synthase F1 subunit gamma n=1 Tax=unclassified Fusibacter TaxID=2624464 RepID=UPI0010107DE8|nr:MULTISPECIES: ATP synthase F1 subunit gamma [unclassified Fusibacter]MCK8059859.1 ATP synthase F1 subunit gamma [Fusibacter sp. A2]NPE21661.1 ATP synthase F1 subunit gamma [Fusibacter sp. A1]RXV62065.1 ATP synthase F1 subunit gamma [Fusibacter sp. A1]